MAEAPNYVLFEHAVGYTLFKVKEFEDIGNVVAEVESSLADPQRFSSIVQVEAFEPFRNTEAALENCNCISEGLAHTDLINFLEAHLPKKKKKVMLGIGCPKVASSVAEQIVGLRLVHTGIVPEVLRGIRMHFKHLAKNLPHSAFDKAQLSLGHSYSRSKVKFDVHRVDNMVIQSIALLDQLDKDVNLFGMRIREWYSYHYPELFKLVPEQYKYVRCATTIMDRQTLDDAKIEKLKEVLEDDEKVEQVVEAARTSMGMEIAELDLANIELFGKRVASLSEYRTRLHEYIKDRMGACAPSLSALIGEQVGARLISHAGSLTNLAKCPASTVQILGAEKALFRALKTRTNTPKHGLLFHSAFIGKASIKNKGRISRFLANKCAIASRIDCFSEIPVATFGEFLNQQVQDRLTYFETGQVPKKNLEVMKEAAVEAEPVKAKVLKKRKKAAKKAKQELEESTNGHDENNQTIIEESMEVDEPKPKKKKKAKKEAIEN